MSSFSYAESLLKIQNQKVIDKSLHVEINIFSEEGLTLENKFKFLY